MEHTNDEKFRKAIAPKSDQLNSDDLIGGNMTIKVTKVVIKDSEQQPIDIFYEGSNKPYRPCKSMGRVLNKTWGGPSNWIGKSMTLFRDDKVTWAGMEVGGIRISHVSDIPTMITMSLTKSKNNRAPYEVKPLKVSAEKKAETVAADPAVVKAGDNAAAAGVASYTAWLATLAPEVKATIKPRHTAWTAKAKAADVAALASMDGDEEEIP